MYKMLRYVDGIWEGENKYFLKNYFKETYNL